jgi:membrane-associated phospholipid phosphatase
MFSFDYNPEWLLAYRSDTLTTFFKIFPLFVSGYFCFTIIALGYWLRPKNRVFVYLGAAVPLTVILNHYLKFLFKIPRPPVVYHLINVGKSYGFPSGDALLSTVFFGMIFMATSSRALKTLCISMVLCIMASRVYLGVHSPYDVLGGAFLGIILVAFWNTVKNRDQLREWKGWMVETNFLMWVTFFLIFYGYWETTGPIKTGVLMSFGVLLGWGLAQSSIHQNLKISDENASLSLTHVPFKKWVSMSISMAILIAIAKFPTLKANFPIGAKFITVAKYAVISYLIYSTLPKFQRWFETRE